MPVFDTRETSVSKRVSPTKESQMRNRDSHRHFRVKNPSRYQRLVTALMCTSIFIALWSGRIRHISETQRKLLTYRAADFNVHDEVYAKANLFKKEQKIVHYLTPGTVTKIIGENVQVMFEAHVVVLVKPYDIKKIGDPCTLPDNYTYGDFVVPDNWSSGDPVGTVVGEGEREGELAVVWAKHPGSYSANSSEIKRLKPYMLKQFLAELHQEFAESLRRRDMQISELKERNEELQRQICCSSCMPVDPGEIIRKYKVGPCDDICYLCSACLPTEEEGERQKCPVCKREITTAISIPES